MNYKLKILFSLTILFILISCSEKHNETVLKAVNYDELKQILNKEDNVLYVVNFWATWCGPCVEELPGFMEVNNEFGKQKNFQMILVSLDNAKELETTVKLFLQKNKINTDVYILDDNLRMNFWIPDIDRSWSGALPATLIIKNGKKLFFTEGQMNKTYLKKVILQKQ